MGQQRKSAQTKKDSERAALMKKLGIVRRTTNCPICHRTITIGTSALMNHFNTACH